MSAGDSELEHVERPPHDELANLARLSILEQQVAALTAEVADLRESVRPTLAPSLKTLAVQPSGPHLSPALSAALRQPPVSTTDVTPRRPSLSDRVHAGAAISGDELESLVGRYATLALAALVILMAVGAIIKMAVQRGLLTPEVRVEAGVLVAVALAVAGLIFRYRHETRFGNVLLALSLAVVDLVAWGAGPRLHLLPTSIALSIVDVVAIALAALALHDESEFLFIVSVAGALSSPFVTSDGGGSALSLLLYGGTVLAAAQRAVRDPAWTEAFGVLILGALIYAVSATMLPVSLSWYGADLVALFAGACAAAALFVGVPEWKSELPRAYLAVAIVGVIDEWNGLGHRSLTVVMAIALGLVLLTYLTLFVRTKSARLWTASAMVLPGISLSVAYAAAGNTSTEGALFALWSTFALVAWFVERRSGDWWRAGVHLTEAALLGCLAITAWLWATPLEFVAGLAGWGVCVAALSRTDESTIPLWGIGLATAAAAISAIDQLISRAAYAYTPFATRSSASALCAALGLAVAGEIIGRSRGAISRVADRPMRLGVLIGFLIVWGRMEFANAFNHDLAEFLLSSYYAACGVSSIIAGRQLRIGRLRVVGLTLAIYAAVKAVVEVTDISSILLRVGSYAAVGVFLLGAGYLYREKKAAK